MGDFDNKDQLLVDRAYLRWTYRPLEEIWGGRIPELQIIGGRFANPWVYTNLLWDHDLNFEGFAAGAQIIKASGTIYPVEAS